MLRKIVLVVGMCVLLGGCATSGINFKDTPDGIEITPKARTGIMAWLFGQPSLPAGKYEYQASEHEKASVDTKQEMKLIDVNLNKISGN